jgi:hypothetical protein
LLNGTTMRRAGQGKMVAIAIFSIDPAMRRSLEQLLRENSSFSIVGVVDDPAAISLLIDQNHVTVVLADLPPLIAAVGSFFLLRIQSHMARSRDRSDKLHKTYFTPNELRDIGLTDDEINNLGDENDLQGKRWWRSANWWRGLEFTGPLIFVLWIGAILVCVALWWSVKL